MKAIALGILFLLLPATPAQSEKPLWGAFISYTAFSPGGAYEHRYFTTVNHDTGPSAYHGLNKKLREKIGKTPIMHHYTSVFSSKGNRRKIKHKLIERHGRCVAIMSAWKKTGKHGTKYGNSPEEARMQIKDGYPIVEVACNDR